MGNVDTAPAKLLILVRLTVSTKQQGYQTLLPLFASIVLNILDSA
jgi:hypothetical protein